MNTIKRQNMIEIAALQFMVRRLLATHFRSMNDPIESAKAFTIESREKCDNFTFLGGDPIQSNVMAAEIADAVYRIGRQVVSDLGGSLEPEAPNSPGHP